MKKIDEVREQMKVKDPEKEKEFWGKVKITVKHAGAMKRNMLKKGLWRGKAKCPHEGCKGFWHASIAQTNKHMHMRCDGDCGTYMME